MFSRGTTEKLTVFDLPKAKARIQLEEATLWVDLVEPTTEETHEILAGFFNFHPLSIEDCENSDIAIPRHPKVDDYGDYIFTIFNTIDSEESADSLLGIDTHSHQLSAFIGKRYLVTFHSKQLEVIERIAVRCMMHDSMLSRGPDYVYHLIIDSIVDDYIPIAEKLDAKLEEIEESVFDSGTNISFNQLLAIKKKIIRLKNQIIQQREMVNRLARGDFDLISEHETFYYRNVYDHLVRMADLMETYRDGINGIVEAYLNLNANRMNQIMKALAVISTIFLPLTFISSIYGMNFEFMPELHWFVGYPLVWIVFILVGSTMYFWMKTKGWLRD